MSPNNIVRLATSRERPVVKACGSCRWDGGAYDSCKATRRYSGDERRNPDGACGPPGKLWERRIGLFGWLRVFLFGETVSK